MINNFDKNKKYIEKRLSSSLDSLDEFPRYFLIETIKGCNAKCVMCPIEQSNRQAGVMDEKLFSKIVTEMSDYASKIQHVGLYLMGEPLLDKDIFNKIKMLNDIGVKESLVATNGSLLDEKNIERLLEAKLDKIYISVDGFTKESYEKIRKGLSFQSVVNNVQNLFKLRNKYKSTLKIRLQLILQKKNINDLEQWKSYWQKFLTSRDELKVIKVTNWGMQVDVHDFDIDELSAPCVSPFGTLIVLCDGRVPLCCSDFDCKIYLGDVNKTSIKEIWQSRKLNKIRNDFLYGKIDIPLCVKCNVWRDDKYYDDIK